MADQPQTWHYGLVARHWAEHNTGGPEITYFQRLLEREGGPALDAGCGTGRLLIPFLQAGLDVDGCDVSADMLTFCRERAEREGLTPRLHQQALHELDLPRSYQTIIVCGVFGLGASHQQNALALQHLHRHLHPGGLLLLDTEVPYADAGIWKLWPKKTRDRLPEPWPDTVGKTPPMGGKDYELYSRVVAFDPLEQRVTREMRTELWRDGRLIAEQTHTLHENLYFRNELDRMLEQAGFTIEAVQGDYQETAATAEHDFVVFVARK